MRERNDSSPLRDGGERERVRWREVGNGRKERCSGREENERGFKKKARFIIIPIRREMERDRVNKGVRGGRKRRCGRRMEDS